IRRTWPCWKRSQRWRPRRVQDLLGRTLPRGLPRRKVRTLPLGALRAGGDDAMLVAMELASGAVAAVSFAAPADCPRESVAVASLRGTVTAEGRQTVMLRRCGHDETSMWGTQAHWPGAQGAPERAQGFLPQMEQFARAVAGEEGPLSAINDAAYALRLVELAGDSAGELVEVS
ncbi:MAG: hypothetical protein ACOCX2_03520, partial [Armatimonadota bacterium]